MPEHFDVGIVGAGILGLAHAYHFARRGLRVIVFERSPRAQGASVRNFGMIWPIGQPEGPMLKMAMRSRELWSEILPAAGIWHDPCGSLHLAYHEDEAQVLAEFARDAADKGYRCELLTPSQTLARSAAVRPDGLKAGLWSATEICVDPRQVIAQLADYLARAYGVRFEFGRTVTGYDGSLLNAGEDFKVDRLIVCAGDDLQALYPDAMRDSGLIACKLQMMRSFPLEQGRIGPMPAAGLTLQHYRAFAQCPTLPALKARFASSLPDYCRFGIHVMVSQNGDNELVIGDSHEYGDRIEPFDKAEIDTLILDYLAGFLAVPRLRIASHWHGIYVKHPSEPYLVRHPAQKVTLVTGVGGAGMTLSFGLADQVVHSLLD